MAPEDPPEHPILARELCFDLNGQRILDRVDLELARGATLGLVGPSGAGKTTLLHICLGRLAPTSGQVRVFGESPGKLRARRHWIGYAPQAPFKDQPHSTPALDFVAQGALPPELARRRPPDLLQRASTIMALTGVEGLESRPIGDLDGMRFWRVRLARALINQPRLLILDELGAGLLAAEWHALYKRVLAIKETLALTVLLVATDIDSIRDIAPEIVCLNHRVFYRGTPNAIEQEAIIRAYGRRH